MTTTNSVVQIHRSVLLFPFCVSTQSLFAQTRIDGRVITAVSIPVRNAIVKLKPLNKKMEKRSLSLRNMGNGSGRELS